MKARNLLVCMCIGWVGLVPLAAPAHPVNGGVMVQVKEQADSESKGKHTRAQSVILEITLRGQPLKPEGRTVKWTAFGRDAKSGATSILESGGAAVDLSKGSVQLIQTKPITTTYTSSHTETKSSSGGRTRGRRVSVKSIDGSGVRYLGYGVQIFEGEKVVGEKFDPKSLEKELSPVP